MRGGRHPVFAMLWSKALPGRAIFYSPILWCGHFALLIAISLIAHRYFERPLQRWVRQPTLNPPSEGG